MQRPPTTSAISPLRVGWLVPQRLGLTFAPGKYDPHAKEASWARDLGEDVARLVGEHGAKTVVPLLEEHEFELLRIPTLLETYGQAGLEVLHFPIRDGHIPAKLDAVRALVRAIVQRVNEGGTVVVHCRGGLGRAGTIGGCSLLGLGKTAKEVFPMLVAARGKSCPENDEQRAFIRRFEDSLRAHPLDRQSSA